MIETYLTVGTASMITATARTQLTTIKATRAGSIPSADGV